MDNLVDFFRDDLFGVIQLTDSINSIKAIPGRLGQMGLFEEQPVTDLTILIEENEGVLVIYPISARGAPAKMGTPEHRNTKIFRLHHIEVDDAVMADEVQGKRKLGSASEKETVAGKVLQKLAVIRRGYETTAEFHKIGAIQGIVYDYDGKTPITNLWKEFSTADKKLEEQSQDFDFTVATKAEITPLCVKVARMIEGALGAAPYDHIHVFCGKNFFDALVGHSTVRESYDRYMNGAFLRSDVRAGFPLGKLIFEEYSGKIGDVSFIDDDIARAFPVGVPGLFKTYHGPADWVETTNRPGEILYARQEIMHMGKGVAISTQTNPLTLCVRPRTLVRITMTQG